MKSYLIVGGSSDIAKITAQKIPLKRINEADEVASSIYWLLTGAPDNFTGQILHLDGGMSQILA